jgi:hypothetical protein
MEVAFRFLRLPMGILDFTFAVTIVGLMLGGFAEPIIVAAGAESPIGSWRIDTFGESLVILPISVLFVVVGPRLLVAWGGVSARLATATLAVVEPRELKRAVGEVLSRVGRADAFEILDQLRLRTGRGPLLTATRLEATLLALESTGILTTRREGARTTYELV